MAFFEYDFKAMGSPCLIQCYCASQQTASQLFGLVHAEVMRLEHKYSRYLDTSELTQINQAAGNGAKTAIDAETYAILNYAQQAFELSDGLFDVTSGVLRKAWDFKSGQLPKPAEVDSLLPLVGWRKVQWNQEAIYLPEKGMEIDFGGIVKEYAVDRCVALLNEHSVAALVNLGGDIAVTEQTSAENSWQIGIRHPRKGPTDKIANIPLTQGAVAASGDYERFIEVDGIRYSHILNPNNGYPVTKNLATVCVWAPRCVLSGTLTTIAMLKADTAIEWLNDIEIPYIAVDYDMLVHTKNI